MTVTEILFKVILEKNGVRIEVASPEQATATAVFIPAVDSKLTFRESEILRLLALGASLREIARDSKRSVKTVESQKSSLMRKLDIHNKAQLVQYAIQNGIIKVPGVVATEK